MDQLAKEMTEVKDAATDRFFSPRQRQLNIDMILNAIDQRTDFDFQTMLYAYADFAHSVFFNGLMAQASSEAEADQIKARVARAANNILDALEKNPTNDGAEDFTAIMSVVIDLLDYLFKAQAAAGQQDTP